MGCPGDESGTRIVYINPLPTKGVVFISYKNKNVNKDACHGQYNKYNKTRHTHTYLESI